MRGAAEPPAGGDLGGGEVAKPRIGEVVPATAQPLLADPAAEGAAFAGKEPVELADRDEAGFGGCLR